MKASILDLRRRMKDVLRALDRNESVTIYYRGKEKAILSPSRHRSDKSVKSHEAFGMWRDRKDTTDVDAYVRDLRKGRLDDFRYRRDLSFLNVSVTTISLVLARCDPSR